MTPVSLSTPSTQNGTVDRDEESPNTSGGPNKSENEPPGPGPRPRPKSTQRPSMSKVILKTMAEKRRGNSVSQAALKKAVIATGYNMARNTWHFNRVLQNLVKKGMLKQVTSKGASGSFRLIKKPAFKSKGKVKRRQQSRRRQQRQRPGQRRSGPRRSGPRGSGPRGSLPVSKSPKLKRVRKVAKGCRH